jgi:magnesium-transporting ATPase (P-type)
LPLRLLAGLSLQDALIFAVGLLSNPLLLWGIAFEVGFTAALIYLPPLQALFGTRPLGPADLALLATFPVIVWGVDEVWRMVMRRRARTAHTRSV